MKFENVNEKNTEYKRPKQIKYHLKNGSPSEKSPIPTKEPRLDGFIVHF